MTKRVLVATLAVALCAAGTQAAINATGDVTPADPATWTSTTQASVGNTGVGSLTVDDGSGVLSYKASIGRQAGSTGNATVSGAGTTWADAYQISVGTYGDGTLDILDGAAVSSKKGSIAWLSPSSTGALVVDGPGSTWTYTMWFMVGGVGHGTMDITNGGSVRAPLEDDSEGIVGYALATGAATVDGAGSTWAAERMMVGFGGDGTLDITAGGLVSSVSGIIGTGIPELAAPTGTGIVTVDGVGSAWTNSGILRVGVAGSGTLNITGGGAASNGIGYIGIGPDSTGEVTVSGTGSTWTNSDDLYVGRSSNGTLGIANGGLVSVQGLLTIDASGAGNSYINMTNGGMLAINGQADDSLASFLGLIDGTDAIRYWDRLANDWGDITGATLGQDYTLSYLTAGDLAGYTMLTVEWYPVGDFDGDRAVNGDDIDALADFLRSGSAYDSLYDVTGPGDDGLPDGNVDIADLDYLVHFLVETSVGLGTEYGDFNLDGLVDTTDLTRLATNFGPGSTWAEGNANRNLDLVIDTTDLTILATNFGFIASADAIPEPATLFVLGCGAVGVLRRRRRA